MTRGGLALAVSLLAAGACSDPDCDLTGTWSGTTSKGVPFKGTAYVNGIGFSWGVVYGNDIARVANRTYPFEAELIFDWPCPPPLDFVQEGYLLKPDTTCNALLVRDDPHYAGAGAPTDRCDMLGIVLTRQAK